MAQTVRTTSIRASFTELTLFFLLTAPFTVSQVAGSFEDVTSRATAAREQNDVPRAIELYAQAVQINPNWLDGWWFLGSLQYGSGSYAAARDALGHFIELTPNAGPALALRGLCEFETGEFEQSLADIDRGIFLGAASEPRNEQILRYHEGLLLTHLGRFDAALKAYAFFAQKVINNPELLVAIGLAGLRMPLFPKDAPPGQQALLTDTGNAAFEFMAGDEDKAAQAFENLFQRFPDAANAHYLYGLLLYPSDPDAAVAQFKREVEKSAVNENAQVMAAWALLILNNPSEALPYARQAAKIGPSLPTAQIVLGRSLIETGNLTEGIEHLERATQLEPRNLEAHLGLVKAYSNSGRREDARHERELCLRMAKNATTQVTQP
jgi:tetratricopeptide (TPR) repeat protein